MHSKTYIDDAQNFALHKLEAIKNESPKTVEKIQGIEDTVIGLIAEGYLEGAIRHDCNMVDRAFDWMQANASNIVFSSNLQSLKEEFINAMKNSYE